ncbi:unnamed protein product [Euphydryas editha]|uniref:RNase H type-1 domain-containing protein n=1 Tax=Euphydryas editha TaxID=104508 RepID=A0AAU9UYV3_EUPED|nr:unnamed protein product [Euphydryas editha]
MKFKLHLIFKIKELLFNCSQKSLDIVLARIPTHSGIEGNEMVDSWAKDATVSRSENHTEIYYTDLLRLVNSNFRNGWQDLWDSSRLIKGRYYVDIQPLIPRKPWFFRFV